MAVAVVAAERPPRTSIFWAVVNAPTVRLIVRRIGTSIPVLFGVSLLTFALLNLLPGDAATALLGTSATPVEIRALEVRLHLNEPFFVRYGHWLWATLHGNLGSSLASSQPVTSILAQRLPVSFEVIIGAFVISLLFAIPVAVLAARKPRGAADRLSIFSSMFGLAVPNFVLALLLIFVFAVRLKLVPVLGYVSIGTSLGQNLRSMVLPCVTIGFGLFSVYTRVLRADIVEQMDGEDYITTALAKGVGPWTILIRHALRNSVFGLITLVGLNFGTLVGAIVIIEQIFAVPGIGSELIQAINNRDVPVIEGIVVVLAVVIVLANLIADLLYAVLDPRIRYGRPAR